MSSTGARWTKHRPIALGIAADYRIPGMDPDDVRQEALLALWEAARAYDPEKGPFTAFARLVIKRRLADQIKAARTQKRSAPTVELTDTAAADQQAGRADLQLTLDTLPSLTPLERGAVAAQLNGTYDWRSSSQMNALYTARRKLKQALAPAPPPTGDAVSATP
jgi:RNA polymerase sigma factor (sigma-70 family)